MKIRLVVLGLAGVIGLFLAFEVGRYFVPHQASNNRLITISKSPPPDIGKCEVDFPVALVRYSAHHSVQWASNDNPYWISFMTIKPPLQVPPYQPENPLISATDPVYVPPGGQTQAYNVKENEKYYYYAIYDHAPNGDNSNPCKDAGDDRDTGLNVKP